MARHTAQNRKEAIEQWKQWCDTVQTRSVVSVSETPAEREARIRYLLANYGRFFNYYLSHYCDDEETGKHTDCAPFHIEAAHTLRDNPTIQYAAEWARGHAKSVHYGIGIPMFLKALGKLFFIIAVR